jgi:hypothetical protein
MGAVGFCVESVAAPESGGAVAVRGRVS